MKRGRGYTGRHASRRESRRRFPVIYIAAAAVFLFAAFRIAAGFLSDGRNERDNSALRDQAVSTAAPAAVMLGHAVGDALGVPVEFRARETMDRDPVTGMRGQGTYFMPAGAWSDDTSMSLCALESLLKGVYDPDDVMKNFGRWYYDGEFTPTGEVFDAGLTCSAAIGRYFKLRMGADDCGLSEEDANGNGSLMRIHPFALFAADGEGSIEEKLSLIHAASALTHAHERSKLGCGIYAFALWALLKTPRKESVQDGLRRAEEYYRERGCDAELGKYNRVFSDIRMLPREEIRSGGYVVHTLEAALWCLMTTESYQDCVLSAVNLGNDTDTTAAVAGGLAGALYGVGAIPEDWLNTLLKREYIEELCR